MAINGCAWMRMSRGVKITVTYGSGDQGKNDSTVLFYRAMADYSLISRLVNVVTYSSSDTVRPQRILYIAVFYYSLLLMCDPSTFLTVPSCSLAQMTRKERRREVNLTGRRRETYTWFSGEVACFSLKKTCFSSK